MFALKRSTTRCHYLGQSLEPKRFLSAQPQPKSNSDEYTDKPEYPEILELSREARMKREKQSWHEQIKAVPTIEEKLIKINMPRYYGFKTIMLNSEENPYNCLPLNQHYTRTVFEGYEKLPNTATKADEASKTQMESFVKSVSANIQDAIEYSNEFFKERYGYDSSLSAQQKDKLLGQIIVENLNRTLINSLSADAAHLSEIEIDLNPRHEAFWSVGGVNPSKDAVKSRKGRDWQKDTVYMPVERLVQYTGEPYLAIRHSLPLAPIKSIEESSSVELAKKIPIYKFDARTLGYKTNYRHATNIPVTRSKRMEQFLWHEFYEEYIRSKENSNSLQSDGKPITTEYIDEYGKLVDTNLLVKKNNDMEIMEELLKNRFPLYSDAAITFWNPKGNVSRNFGKTLSITLPISEQHGQFG